MLYTPWIVILGDDNIKKIGLGNFDSWAAQGEKLHKQVVSAPKTDWGMRLSDERMILQGVKLTVQPLGAGYANRPKKAKDEADCGVFPYIGRHGYDLITSAR